MIPGKVNIADWLTESTWQHGPQILKERIEDWPVSKNWALDDLPEMIRSYTNTGEIDIIDNLQGRIDTRFSKLKFRINSADLVLGMYRKYSHRNVVETRAEPIGCKVDVENAKVLWIRDAQLS